MNLQTKTTSTNTRNFFQKTFILLAILAFTSFGFKAKAQQTTFTVTNNAPLGCNWLVILVDNSGTHLNSFVSYGSSGTTHTVCYGSYTVDHIAMSYASGGCMGYNFGSSGLFPYTSVSPSCFSTSTIDCVGVTTTVNCGAVPPVGDYTITININ